MLSKFHIASSIHKKPFCPVFSIYDIEFVGAIFVINLLESSQVLIAPARDCYSLISNYAKAHYFRRLPLQARWVCWLATCNYCIIIGSS